jgi:hypothetical protein
MVAIKCHTANGHHNVGCLATGFNEAKWSTEERWNLQLTAVLTQAIERGLIAWQASDGRRGMQKGDKQCRIGFLE